MLQYCQMKFVFIATSMKIDVVDSFEKRIKSRFSHRQVLLYEQDCTSIKNEITSTLLEINETFKNKQDHHNALKIF